MTLDRDATVLFSILAARPFPVASGKSEAGAQEPVWGIEQQQAALGILWRDLEGKAPDLRAILLPDGDGDGSGPEAEAQAGLSATAPRPRGPGGDSPPKIDVLIVCPLPKELAAALVAFGESPSRREDMNLDGRKVFILQVARSSSEQHLTVALTVMTRARNVPAAIATDRLIRRLAPEAVILCGIGGGVKGKVDLGDVVVATTVRDVAGGRKEVARVRPRHQDFELPLPIERQLSYFPDGGVDAAEWKRRITVAFTELRRLANFPMPEEADLDAVTCRIRAGIVVAGEQLVADGSLPDTLEQDDRIRCCEMEGSGFAQSCDEHRVQWCVFRGISDYGDPAKHDGWQAVAACAAALAVRLFLETEYRLLSETQDPSF